jgi:ABC-type Fe3+-siderophore transport system permease subunit
MSADMSEERGSRASMDRNRRVALALMGAAAIAWLGTITIGMTVDPIADPNAGLAGAIALGAAVGLTSAPLLWLISFARHRRIAYRGDWLRASRRGAWVGILVAIFVVMRINGIFQPQIGLFLAALAVVAEVTLTAGGASRG